MSRPALKKTGALCWCPKFVADFSQAADLIYESGNCAALKYGIAEAISRGDSQNARRLLDQLVIKTPPEARDPDWIRATERSVARLQNGASQKIDQRAVADLLNLPTGMQSSGDPIEGNPFPVVDPRYKVWDDATHGAEEQWCRLSSESENTRADRPDVLIDSVCKRIAGKFDIWAKRGVHVVWSYSAVRAYDQWLINYAEAWLQDVSARKLYSRVVPLHDLLAALRLVLTKRVAWWKAEARRYVAEQKAYFAKENATAPKSEAELRTKLIATEPAALSSSRQGSAKPGRALARSSAFVNFAAKLWLDAKRQSGNASVTGKQLNRIASSLDDQKYVPPAKYLEGSCARELKSFNSKNSNSRVGPIQTWSQLVAVGDKDHLRGMRRLLSRCAEKHAL